MDQEISIKGYILILNSLMQKSDQWGKSAMKTVYLALYYIYMTISVMISRIWGLTCCPYRPRLLLLSQELIGQFAFKMRICLK